MSEANLGTVCLMLLASGIGGVAVLGAGIIMASIAAPGLAFLQNAKNNATAMTELKKLGRLNNGTPTGLPTCLLGLEAGHFAKSATADTLESTKLLAVLQAGRSIVRKGEEANFRQQFEALMKTSNFHDFETQHASFMSYLRQENTLAVREVTLSAAKAATIKLGFTKIQAFTVNPTTTSLVAEDEDGTAIVNELHVTPDSMPELRSEVHGAPKGQCSKVMDAFMNELYDQGVLMIKPGKRHDTGGVATLLTTKRTIGAKPQSAAKKARLRTAQKAKVTR